MASVEWRQSKFYGGKVAWFNGTLYRVTKINDRKYAIDHGGNFYNIWKALGEASSMREAEDMCSIHSEGNTDAKVEAPKDSTDN